MKNFLFILLFSSGGAMLVAGQDLNSKRLGRSIDELVLAHIGNRDPGAAIVVAREGKVVYKKAFGSADLELNTAMAPEMVFRVGSVTKQFTAIGILQLVEEGRISLKDSVQRYLRDFPSKGRTITIENLLTHTSGIPDYSNADTSHNPFIERQEFTPEQLTSYFNYSPLEFEPGTRYNYSNSGYVLLARIIEKVSGMGYHVYMKEKVFARAGLGDTRFANEHEIVNGRVKGYTRDRGFYENCEYQTASLAFGCGDLMTTVEDLNKWNNALMSGRVVKKETLDRAFTPFRLKNETETQYGFGWFVNEMNGRKCIHHEGQVSGFTAIEEYYPAEKVFVAILTNLLSGEDTTDFSGKRFELYNQVAKLALGQEADMEQQAGVGSLDLYAGNYMKGKDLITISKNKDRLIARVPPGSSFEMIPVSADKFKLKNVSPLCTLDFVRDSAGGISEFIVMQKGVFNWIKLENKEGVDTSHGPYPDYLGRYQLMTMNGAFATVSLENNHLMVESTTGLDKAELLPGENGQFIYSGQDAKLLFEFGKDSKGNVNKMIITQVGGVRCKRVK